MSRQRLLVPGTQSALLGLDGVVTSTTKVPLRLPMMAYSVPEALSA